jgi:hypothetical protein
MTRAMATGQVTSHLLAAAYPDSGAGRPFENESVQLSASLVARVKYCAAVGLACFSWYWCVVGTSWDRVPRDRPGRRVRRRKCVEGRAAAIAAARVEHKWREHLGDKAFDQMRDGLVALREITDPYL